MFQNIINNIMQENEEEINSGTGKESFIKKFFSVQNILLYFISFMVSMTSFFGGIAPFGLAILASAMSFEIPIGIIYLCTCIGTLIGFGKGSLLLYLLMSLSFMAVSLIFKTKIIHKEEEEIKRLGFKLFFTVLGLQLIFKMQGGLLIYEVLESLMFAIAACIFYKVFRGCITVIRDYVIKTAFSVEEVLGASLMLAIALSAFGEWSVFGFSIRNICSILIVLILGWNNGILVGGTGGTIIRNYIGNYAEWRPYDDCILCCMRHDCWNISKSSEKWELF